MMKAKGKRHKSKAQIQKAESQGKMRLRHPSYHAFADKLNGMLLPEFRHLVWEIIQRRSRLTAVQRAIVMGKAREYEKLGILNQGIEKPVEVSSGETISDVVFRISEDTP